MEQELIRRKREIIDICLKNGILISAESLKRIKDEQHLIKISESIKTRKIENDGEIDFDKLIAGDNSKTIIQETEQPKKLNIFAKTNIIYSYTDEPKKREPQDFADYLNNRYRALEKILKQFGLLGQILYLKQGELINYRDGQRQEIYKKRQPHAASGGPYRN